MVVGLGIDKVSAVIVSWKRPNEVGQIVENLHQYDFIDEIIIAVNKPDDNKKCYRRWLAALGAKNSTIYTQDDDCIIGNIQELYDTYHKDRMVIGMKGNRIKDYFNAKSAMVGWGTFFEKDWIDFTDYIEKYGEDDLLIRESDRIITYKIGCERPHNFQAIDIVDFPSAASDFAMYKQKEHWDTRDQAINRAQELYA